MEEDLSNQKIVLPAVPDRSGPPTISLALLLDFAIQNTSHELTILAELLPKKKEADRKISVVQFAHSTRIIFVKLLAIVKWLRISKKFEPLTAIRYFLQQQAATFEDGADRLFVIAKNDLKSARLSLFQVPSAVDVLTLGSFPRLPLDIKDRFILRPPLTLTEQALTLRRLNHSIEYLIHRFSQTISPRINSLVIRNGMATIRVKGEFELCLTLFSEEEPFKWLLLNVKVLTECSEIALGQKLVHPLQINLIHQIIQEKLTIGSNPLHEAYVFMHSFCQSLQLEVLYHQALKFSAISHLHNRVEYNPVTRILVIHYWLTSNLIKKKSSTYRVTIYADDEDIYSGLKIRHRPTFGEFPTLNGEEENISLSRFMGLTIAYRCREKLLRIKEKLEAIEPYAPVRLSGNSIPTLTYPLIQKGKRYVDESLEISINTFTGALFCQVRTLARIEEIVSLENALGGNASRETLSKILARLRVLVIIERFNKAILALQVRTVLNQRVVENQLMPLLNKLKHMPCDRRILQFNREEQYYLIVTFTPDSVNGVVLGFYLASVIGVKCQMTKLDSVELLKMCPLSTIELCPQDDPMDIDESPGDSAKIAWIGSEMQLQAAIAAIDDRLLFLRISEELDKRGIHYRPLEIEPVIGGNVLRMSEGIPVAADHFDVPKSYCADFFSNLVSCSLRLDLRVSTLWPFECTMINCPLVPDDDEPRNLGQSQPSKYVKKNRSCTWVLSVTSPSNHLSMSETASTQILERLSTYCHIYVPVKRFSFVYDEFLHRNCCIKAFTYHKLVLAYGDNRDLLMILSWRSKAGKIRAQYTITFAQCDTPRSRRRIWNPHVIVEAVINEKFNQNQDLVGLVCYLVNSYKSLDTIYQFSRVKLHSIKALTQVLAIEAVFPVELMCNLNIMSETQIHLTYGSSHIEFLLLNDNYVVTRETASIPITSSGRIRAGNSTSIQHGYEMFWRRLAPNEPTLKIPRAPPISVALARPVAESAPAPTPIVKVDVNAVRIADRKKEELEMSPAAAAPGSPYNAPPRSFPSIQVVQPNSTASTSMANVNSPSSMISQRMTLSVPPICSHGLDTSSSAAQPKKAMHARARLSPQQQRPSRLLMPPFYINPSLLKEAMLPDSDGSPSPLENYLYGLNYLSRLYAVVDASRRVPGPTNLPVRELRSRSANASGDPFSVSLTVPSYPLPTVNAKEPSVLHMSFFINSANKFRLSVKLEYIGSPVPTENDVQVFMRYFENHVVHLFNEMAVVSFIALCRIVEPSIHSSFAQIMRMQMEVPSDASWFPSIQLTMGEDMPAQQIASGAPRKVQCGITMNETCKKILFVISMRNIIRIGEKSTIGHDRRQYTFIYDVIGNTITQHVGYLATNPDKTEMAVILERAASRGGGACAIGVCVRAILDHLAAPTPSTHTTM